MTTTNVLSTGRREDFSSRWREIADKVLEGGKLTRGEGLAVLNAPDEEILEILAAAYRVRLRYHGNLVRLNLLINAKSGICPEDCAYCSQSRISSAEIRKYPLVDRGELLRGAQAAVERQATMYCIAISGRSPNPGELDAICGVVSEIKSRWNIKICVSPGLLNREQANRFKAAGVDRINHNLNTSRRFYDRICSTHSYEDRLATLRAAREAGLELCCGGVVGMGESLDDVVDFAMELGELRPESLPINFLIPIPGTPMENQGDLSPLYCLKVLSLLRFAGPTSTLRIAAGRELHLGPLQPLGLFPADSIFVGDYLTTKGRPPEEDYRMIEALGMEVVLDPHS
ncbi:MAG: biotin synthase BioB [Thermogutta sp.]|nr:biotin synthase BioB [Thermogutta sp.]